MSSLNNYSSIPVRPLPQNAFDAAYDSLTHRGFKGQSMIQRDYPFSDRDGRLVKPNLLAFAHETSRGPDYTGLTVFSPVNGISDEQLVQTLAQSGAPFHLIHRHQTERYSFWFTNARAKDAQLVDVRKIETGISYSQLNQVIEAYAADIQPQRIIDVKQGRDSFHHFKDAGAFQLALWAIDVTGERLVQHFGNAVEVLRHHQVPLGTVPDLSTQLLGATILAHTGAFGSRLVEQDVPLGSLIDTAVQYFPNYFNQGLFNRYALAASDAYRILTELRYSNFSPELLTQLYRAAFPDVAQRRKLGRYDTPLYLTRRIWQTLPIEFLPPEKRILADMTCGWGSFLISGYERLSRMIDMEGRAQREHIYGNDIEQFTAKLARLGLLTSTLTDSWNITNQNALGWNLRNIQPGIIVGNPPFHGSRKDPSEEHADSSSRFEKANQFLDHAIDILAPDGYLAIIMPQSFVAAEASPSLRKKLLENCDVFEMWDLPIGVFSDAQANSLVIFARKKTASFLSSLPVRVRMVQTKQQDVFKDLGLFTTSSLVSSQTRWDERSRRSKFSKNTHIIDYSFILPHFVWEKIQSNSDHLSSKAEIFNGLIRGSDKRRRYSDSQDGFSVQWITNTQNVIHDSFQMTHAPESHAYIYPNDFEEPRIDKRQFLEGEKVLINALANPSWGKRVKAVIERKGYFVSDSFNVLVPKEHDPNIGITVEVIAAIVDWKVSNAWLLEHHKYPRFRMKAIREIPFPNLSNNECLLLTSAVSDIEQAWLRGEDPPPNVLQIIDDTLRKAYQLDDETYKRLSLISGWDSKSLPTLDLQFDSTAQWEISGIVDNVDAENGEITFWFDGFDELQTLPIVPVMPGWLLRPEVAFRTSVPRACFHQRSLANNTSWGFFYPQDYAYLTEEEAFAELLETLN